MSPTMLRNRTPLSILQKTYDESYLTCSKAVYYESQGNEAEAMRCWKSALNQINDHHANKLPSTFVARSETEKALADSLRELGLQCKERIDLLEALRLSRQDEPSQQGSSSSSTHLEPASDALETERRDKGWIGCGTIPAITYPELSRPALPPRPSMSSRTSSEHARKSSLDPGPPPATPLASVAVALSSAGSIPSPKPKSSRTPSPERHTMRTTLRTNRPGDKSFKPPAQKSSSKPSDGPGASKAASLAWSALCRRDSGTKTAVVGQTASQTVAGTSHQPGNQQESVFRAPMRTTMQWDSNSRRLVRPQSGGVKSPAEEKRGPDTSVRHSDEFPFNTPSPLSVSAASSALGSLSMRGSSTERLSLDGENIVRQRTAPPLGPPARDPAVASGQMKPYAGIDPDILPRRMSSSDSAIHRKNPIQIQPPSYAKTTPSGRRPNNKLGRGGSHDGASKTGGLASSSSADESSDGGPPRRRRKERQQQRQQPQSVLANAGLQRSSLENSSESESTKVSNTWKRRRAHILRNLPPGIDEHAAKQILNEIIVRGDEVHWSDIAGLEIAKKALRETVVYPFLRPDLFMGLREPARGMLLFGPPGTGKTMLARAVATESNSTFFSISASSLTSKYLGESEKLVRALFALAKALAPSIIFVDEIDSLLSHRSGSGDHEATRRIKTEFLIQWSDLQRAAAGRDTAQKDKDRGDANQVLVLAATNLPWAIDEAARRRFVRRQYIPLPEPETRAIQLTTLLAQQKHGLSDEDIDRLVGLTEGFSGSDITALAKDAAMGPLRSLGDALLHMTMDQIRPIELADFEASLTTIRPSVSKAGLEEYENWAKEFGERGG